MLTPGDFAGRGGSSFGMGLIRKGTPDPRAYLRYAREDLADPNSERTRINALSNAKRALHLQIELLTDALGYQAWRDRGRDGFPRRLRLAERCGLIAPGILSRVNALRNEVEHDYAVPDRSMVEDYTDVVALYLGASDPIVRSFPCHLETHIGPSAGRTPYCLHTNIGSGILKLYQSTTKDLKNVIKPIEGAEESTPILVVGIDADEDQYFGWVRCLLSHRTG